MKELTPTMAFEALTRYLENGQILDPAVAQWIAEFADTVRRVADAFKGLGEELKDHSYRCHSRRHYRLNRARRPGRR